MKHNTDAPEVIVNTTSDTFLGAAMISTPVWLQWIEESLALFALAGGAILLILRIWLAVRELRKKEDN